MANKNTSTTKRKSSDNKKSMSTATKVAIATTAGALAATAAGLATTERGKKIRRKVTNTVQDLVEKGAITLKRSGMQQVVNEIEAVVGSLIASRAHDRSESARTSAARTSPADRSPARRGPSRGRRSATTSRRRGRS